MKIELVKPKEGFPKWELHSREMKQPFFWTIYRDNYFGVQKQVRELLYNVRFRRKLVTYYFIDGVKRSFRTEAKMIKKYLKLGIK